MLHDMWLVVIGAGVGFGVFVLFSLTSVWLQRQRPRPPVKHTPSETVILLQDGAVIDHTQDVIHLFNRSNIQGMGWAELRAALLSGFPDLPIDIPTRNTHWTSQFDLSVFLDAALSDGLMRLTLSAPPLSTALLFRAARHEHDSERLHSICDHTPSPVWQTRISDGQLLWSNEAFEQLARAVSPPDAERSLPFAMPEDPPRSARSERQSLQHEDGHLQWFEVQSIPMHDTFVHFAAPIDTLIDAEMAQRNFIQTLTKTFAHLPTGLAVFDKNRRLALFNPALVDLTHLPVDFLSTRPDLTSFFDRLRDNRMLPEPKNYATWRDKLFEMITAAREDRFAEIWNLPSGLTYKISGRPHPDGAVAFLIEDISSEISLTRRFRSEMDLTQSVLDRIADAVVVFSRLGVLTFSNVAYRTRWKCDPDSAFAETTIIDATRDWAAACEPSPIWEDLQEFVLTLHDRTPRDVHVRTATGEDLRIIVEPVAGAATMVRFCPPGGQRRVRTTEPAMQPAELPHD